MADASSHELTTLSREITRKLTRRIVDEVYPPNTKLPTERELSAEFGVTRHVVREALKRLEALGLVTIRQGSGILVQDLQITGGLELTRSLIKRDDGTLDWGFLNDLLDFRSQIGQAILRLAAENRTDEELARIKAVTAERRKYFDNPAKLNELNAQLFREFAQATHNRVYQMIVNTVAKILLDLRAGIVVPQEIVAQVQRVLEQIVEALEQRDGEVAALLAARHAALMRQQLEQARNGG